jgi:hypothetical protein
MTETAAKTESPKAPAPRTVREKNPTYHVFKLTGDGQYSHLTVGGVIKATGRKDAIVQATAKLEEKAGQFLVIAEKEFKLLTRKVETRVEDLFE